VNGRGIMQARKLLVTVVLGVGLIQGLAFGPRVIQALVVPEAQEGWEMSERSSSDAIRRVTLNPSKDNTLYEDAAGSLSNGAGEYFFVGKNDNELTRRSVVAFDVAEVIPAGSTVLSATLRLNMSRTAAPAQSVTLHRLLADWGEGTSDAPDNEGGGTSPTPGSATWIHTFFNSEFWTTAGGDFSFSASASTMVDGVGAYTWGTTPEMVADIQAWLNTPEVNFGWLLAGNESEFHTTKRFDSRENSDPSNRPVLIVEYLELIKPELSAHKTASVSDARVGQTITYTYQMSNTGTLHLDHVRAIDDKLGAVTLGQTTLAPGERTSGMLTYTVVAGDLPGPLVNSVMVSGTVTGTASLGLMATATAEATVELLGALVYLPVIQRESSTQFQKEQLGRSIFFDDDLSINRNQSCAGCHGHEMGWTGPLTDVNAGGSVYEGSIPGRFGSRRPPSAAYATLSPIFHQDESDQFVGGNFWDGRATGEKLDNPAADQAQGPFLNPDEQGLPDSACVVYRVCIASYPVSFEDVWGGEACDIAWPPDVETVCATEGVTVTLSPEDRARSNTAYDNIALSIAAFEGSAEVNAFTSKFDHVLQGTEELTEEEQIGQDLFHSKGKCHKCHPDAGEQPLFTNFTYDNLGIPQNPENPAGTAPDFVDPGLGGFLKNAGYPEEVYEAEWGRYKAPTLRNLDLRPYEGFVKSFGHNGYFKTLRGIVHFYNTRDVKPVCPSLYTEAEALAADCWPQPEVSSNLNTAEMGDLGLTPEEEDAIVAFLRTLSDGYQP
jgi:cytochrome c peroxidase